MVLTVVQMSMAEFHHRISALYSILQNIMDRTVDIVFAIKGTLETIYLFVYVCLEKGIVLCVPTHYR